MKYLLLFFATIQIIVSGAYIMKWEMQYRYNFPGLPRIAPQIEILIAGLFFFGGLAGMFFILRVKKESEI